MATTRPVGRLPGPITRLVSARLGLALALILAAALGLRLYRIGHQSLWNDEGTSVALAQRDLLAITRDASHDIHPPLYYYLLHIWLRLFGTGEPAARSLSAVAGTALVGVTYGLSRRFWGERAALLAALLAALAPFQVYYSQEARMYILAALLGALSMWAYDRWIERALPSGRSAPGRLVAYVAVSALALYSHYFAATLILAQNLATLVFALSGRAGAPTIEGPLHLRPMQRLPVRTLGTWALSQVAIALFYLPWLALSWRSLRNWPAVSAPMSLGTLLHRLARLLPLGVIAAQEPQALALGVALSALAVVGLVLSGANARVSAPVRRGSWVVGLYLLAPIAAIYLLSLNRPMYKDKFLLLVSPAFGILQARGIVALAGLVGAGRSPGHRLASGVLGLVLAAAAIVPSTQGLRRLYSDETYFRDDYRGIVAYIEGVAGPEDAILVNAPAQIETVGYYYSGPWPAYPLPRQRPMDVADAERELERIVGQHARLYAIFWATAESDPEGFIEGWLDKRCYKALDSWFGNVRLVVYAVPQAASQQIAHPTDVRFGEAIRLAGYTLLTPEPTSGDIVQLTLYWQALAPVDRRYKVFTHLVDARGNIVGQRDSEPGGGGRLTTTWQAGELIVDNYGIPIQPGSPPGEHLLRIGLYGLDDGIRLPVSRDGQPIGDAVDLTRLPVHRAAAPPPIAALDVQTRDAFSWGDLELLGHSLHRLGHEHERELHLRPGDALRLVLFWRSHGDRAADGATLSLVDRRGTAQIRTELRLTGGAYPPSAWQEGEIVRDIHSVTLPGDLAPGSYRLTLGVGGVGETCVLQKLTIEP